MTNRDSVDVVKIDTENKEVTGCMPLDTGPHEINNKEHFNWFLVCHQ